MLFLELCRKHWKALLVLLAILGSGLGGYHYGSQQAFQGVQVVTQTQVQTTEDKKVTEDTKVTTSDHKVVTIDKKPNGETVTTIKDDRVTQKTNDTTVADNKTSQQTQTVTQTPVSKADTYRPTYSLGLNWSPAFANPENKNEYEVNLGYRALGNLWVTGLFNLQTHQAGLGVRVDF